MVRKLGCLRYTGIGSNRGLSLAPHSNVAHDAATQLLDRACCVSTRTAAEASVVPLTVVRPCSLKVAQHIMIHTHLLDRATAVAEALAVPLTMWP